MPTRHPLCAKAGCDQLGHCRANGARLCDKHYRFSQMRVTAKKHGKVAPTWEQLENLLTWTNGMICKDCGRQMNWLRSGPGGPSQQVTLQHYRSGSMALVCLACNTKHARMPGDTYVTMPKDHKRCPDCGEIKPLTQFGRRKSRARGQPLIAQSRCMSCRRKIDAAYQRARASMKGREATVSDDQDEHKEETR